MCAVLCCWAGTIEYFFSDVWVYNILGNSWTSRFPAAPGTPLASTEVWAPPTYTHTAVIAGDPGSAAGNVMTVYGGYSQFCVDYCADLWEYSIGGQTHTHTQALAQTHTYMHSDWCVVLYVCECSGRCERYVAQKRRTQHFCTKPGQVCICSEQN
jgi:hypothetical protein